MKLRWWPKYRWYNANGKLVGRRRRLRVKVKGPNGSTMDYYLKVHYP